MYCCVIPIIQFIPTFKEFQGLLFDDTVILRTGAVLNQWRLARAGKMTFKFRRDFKIITDELSRVSRQFHWCHQTFGDLRFVTQNLYIRKQVKRFLQSLKATVKTGTSKVPRPRPVLPSLLRPICQACVNSQLSSTPPLPPRGMEKKNVAKMNFSSCHDHRPKWIINDCYIFFPYLRAWVFLFLRTPFFKTQHVWSYVTTPASCLTY